MRLPPCKQHHAEPGFAFHHSSISISGLFERECLDHRADILRYGEGKGVLAINRSAGKAAVDRAPSKDERESIQLDRVLRHTYHDELAADCETRHKRPHRSATSTRRENGSGSAHT